MNNYSEIPTGSTTKNDLGVDLISREQAKAAIRDKFKDLPSRVEINTILNELPSVTPQEPRWISVSERLPEYRTEVLTCSSGGYVEIQSLEYSYGGYWENQKGDWSDLDEIIAWMPLPQPYKAEVEPQESEDKE